jgi:serine/threonine-protein kinase
MELLEGEDLRKLIVREGQLPVPRAFNLIIQACRGLRAAHEKGIIHRDLKPENLFVTRRGDGTDLLKILDFGIARFRGQLDSDTFTRPGTMIGTLPYMPIEQVRSETDIDQRADIYALGAILYELLTGTVPHPGEDMHAVIYHLLNEQILPLSSLRPGLPDGLEPVVLKALSTERPERFQSIADLHQALTPFAGLQATGLQPKTTSSTDQTNADTAKTLRHQAQINLSAAVSPAGSLTAFVLGKILEISRIFLRFFLRARSRSNAAGKTGLGKFICARYLIAIYYLL